MIYWSPLCHFQWWFSSIFLRACWQYLRSYGILLSGFSCSIWMYLLLWSSAFMPCRGWFAAIQLLKYYWVLILRAYSYYQVDRVLLWMLFSPTLMLLHHQLSLIQHASWLNSKFSIVSSYSLDSPSWNSATTVQHNMRSLTSMEMRLPYYSLILLFGWIFLLFIVLYRNFCLLWHHISCSAKFPMKAIA